MKGFLQRLAASAIRTAPRTHPLVEPMYAAPLAAEQAAPSLHFEPASPRLRTSEPPTAGPYEGREPHDSVFRHPSNPIANEDAGTSRDFFEPLMRPANGTPIVRSTPVERKLSSVEGSAGFRLQTPLPISPEPSGADDRSEIRSRGLEYLPNVVERLLRADASNALESASSHQQTEAHGMQAQQPRKEPELRTIAAQVNARRQQQAPVSQPSRPAPAQPEEIQIHIGRIEVLAVPQAAPRPAAAPVRKGLSLDDYLSRRNGRNG